MKKGFTLIELLVVVLIIGILAAVAWPQYEKAVWKSRNAQLKAAIRSIASAQKVYYMANGHYAVSFADLEIDLPLPAPSTSAGLESACDLAIRGPDAIRRGENFQFVLNALSANDMVITAVWTSGKYRCNGFMWPVSREDELLCAEARNGSSHIEEGEFCRDLEGGKPGRSGSGWQRYIL